MKILLGIETSCDDTSLAIIRGEAQNAKDLPQILSALTYSQDEELKPFGGVVPEIAARNHQKKLTELLPRIFQSAGFEIGHGPNNVLENLDGIAVTVKPGLIGPLLTGLNFAKTLALWQKLPIIPINHLHAHLEAIFIEKIVPYPYLGVLISGGHSAFYLVNSPRDFQLLGTTTDDAAGEAFDKGGKLMGLGYPAGRKIDELAIKGDKTRFSFPIGLKNDPSCNLSFSGLKTSLRVLLEKNPSLLEDSQDLADLCASYQYAIVEALVLKTKKAQDLVGKNIPLVIGGGVACNSELRLRFRENFTSINFVSPQFCTDNGAMIAALGLRLWEERVLFPDCLKLGPSSQVVNKGLKTEIKN